MKTQTALEYLKCRVSRTDHNTKETFRVMPDNVLNFYSQPFKPEMITEYFEVNYEVFEKDIIIKGDAESFGTLEYQDEFNTISFDLYNGRLKLHAEEVPAPIHGEPSNTIEIKEEFPMPKVLNDYIFYCQESGIELNWKPEIIKQYFQ